MSELLTERKSVGTKRAITEKRDCTGNFFLSRNIQIVGIFQRQKPTGFNKKPVGFVFMQQVPFVRKPDKAIIACRMFAHYLSGGGPDESAIAREKFYSSSK